MFGNRFLSILFLIIVFVIPSPLSAQVPVTVSKQKIVVDGKVYFMHQVLKGQTLYSISKAYNIPIEIITRENSVPDTGIKEGQMLKIPDSSQQTKVEVKAETKKPAHNESLPQSQAQPQTQSQKQDDKYIYHRVEKGETLASVAEHYNVSVRDLKKANKGLLFPEEGEYLMIPKFRSEDNRGWISRSQVQHVTVIQKDTLPQIPDTALLSEETDTIVFSNDKTQLRHLNGSVKIAVMLPFFLRENGMRSYTDSTRTDSKGRKIYKEVYLPGNWIYEGSVPFIEMYEGMLVAVDSLRTMGLKIEMDVYDIDVDTVKTDQLISSGALEGADLIIGPVFSNNLSRVAKYAAEKDIPVVSPVPLRDQTILSDRPTLFRICPSLSVSQDFMIKELDKHQGSNIIFLYSDSLMIDPQTEFFWKKLTDRISMQQGTDSTVVTPLYFSGVTLKGAAAKEMVTLEKLVDHSRDNIIVLSTTETPRVSAAFSQLHTLSKNYSIKVMGYPEIGSLPTIDLRYYYDMELFIPSESYIDFEKRSTQTFIRSYFRRFNTEPAQESFAWRGFDIAYYFIGGLATDGKSFVRRPWKFNTQLLSHDLKFSRDNNQDGFENIGMYILQYNKDMTISVKSPGQMKGQ